MFLTFPSSLFMTFLAYVVFFSKGLFFYETRQKIFSLLGGKILAVEAVLGCRARTSCIIYIRKLHFGQNDTTSPQKWDQVNLIFKKSSKVQERPSRRGVISCLRSSIDI